MSKLSGLDEKGALALGEATMLMFRAKAAFNKTGLADADWLKLCDVVSSMDASLLETFAKLRAVP